MKYIILLTALLIGISLNAQEFLVAAGSSSGTYKQFLTEITKTIPDIVQFKEVESHGAVENLDKLVNNECSGAFVHSDVIYFRSQSEDMSRFKTLLALFQEEVHLLALTTSKSRITNTSGGVTAFGQTVGATKTITIRSFKTMDDLKDGSVGAAGGGYITAQLMRLQSQIPYRIVQFQKGDEVITALNSGLIDAAVFVGGAPLPNLKELGKEYKLLPIVGPTAERMKQVYRPAVLTYTKMNPNPVPTVAADCILLSKEYKSPRMVALLAQFRRKFYASLDELKETPGNHRKWQQVSADEHGRWPWLELGEATNSTVKN